MNQSTLSITDEGTAVPLSDGDNAVSRSTGNKEVFIPADGTYLVFYSIYTSESVQASAALFVDGTLDERTLISPAVPSSAFMNTSVLTLEGGSVLELVLFGTDETVTLAKGVGANLTAVKIA